MNIGIEPEHLKKILGVFRTHPQIKDVLLFGSRANGNYREGSDIDLALKGNKLASQLLTQISMDYDALYLPWKLDVIIYDQIENAELKDHVDRVGVSLF